MGLGSAERQSGAGRAGRQAVLCPLPRGSQPVPHPENGEARTAPRRPSRGGFSCGRMRGARVFAAPSIRPKVGRVVVVVVRAISCCCSEPRTHRKSTCKYVDIKTTRVECGFRSDRGCSWPVHRISQNTRNPFGNLTPAATFSCWKFPWKYNHSVPFFGCPRLPFAGNGAVTGIRDSRCPVQL